jgi:hypothetical protein
MAVMRSGVSEARILGPRDDVWESKSGTPSASASSKETGEAERPLRAR